MQHLLTRAWLLAGILVAAFPVFAQTPVAKSASDVSFGAQHPVLSGLLAGTLGFVLGAWLVRRWASKHYHRIIHQVRQKAREEAEHAASARTVKTVKPPTDYELKLREENAALKKQLAQLTQQLSDAQAEPEASPNPAAAPAALTLPPQPAPASATIEEVLGVAEEASATDDDAAVAPEAQSTVRYAPVQETNFLRDNKLAADPLPQLPLVLTFSPDDPNKASFTLSPHVNQAKLIGDGLHQLSEFFDFDLPTGRIAAVSADAPGQLVRQGDGWQVVSRARLLVQ